jgi:hypothetical protein
MAKGNSGKGAGDGANVPHESVELSGAIVTAAKSLTGHANFERGFPEPSAAGWDRLKMDNLGGKRR